MTVIHESVTRDSTIVTMRGMDRVDTIRVIHESKENLVSILQEEHSISFDVKDAPLLARILMELK